MERKAKKIESLPTLVAGPADVGRLLRELGNIEEALLQLGLRSPGATVKMPKTSSLMDQTIDLNDLNLLHESDRKNLKLFLETVKQKAPVLHISFSADPSTTFIDKLMAWLRKEIHPQLLLSIGLQPNIGAGCIIRSTNKHFDLSLKQDFINKRELLMSKLMPKEAKS